MSEKLNDSDLLGYVEDALDALDAEALAGLRARLAGDDALRERLDRLRRDRMVLRSLGEPELPVDFIASLEESLVRPLLIEGQPPMGQPGVYRRRHRAASRRMRVARYAIAAVVLVALGAGIWITATQRSTLAPAPAPGRTVAVAPDDGSRTTGALPGRGGGGGAVAPSTALADGEDAIDLGAEVHHWGPLAPPATTVAASDGSRAVDDRVSILTVPLVLVLEGDDVEAAEALLERAVASLNPPPNPASPDQPAIALVRNFSMSEARRLEERYFPGRAVDPRPAAVAGVGTEESGAAGAETMHRQRERLARMLDTLRDRPRIAEDEPVLESRLLYGAEGLASYEKQLELSGRGATHTIAVPADAFGALLRGLHRLDGPAATLRSFDGWTDGDASDAGAQTMGEWIAERRAIDAFLATLRDRDASGSMLLVPVVVE